MKYRALEVYPKDIFPVHLIGKDEGEDRHTGHLSGNTPTGQAIILVNTILLQVITSSSENTPTKKISIFQSLQQYLIS
jgi:hypothetical protein